MRRTVLWFRTKTKPSKDTVEMIIAEIISFLAVMSPFVIRLIKHETVMWGEPVAMVLFYVVYSVVFYVCSKDSDSVYWKDSVESKTQRRFLGIVAIVFILMKIIAKCSKGGM